MPDLARKFGLGAKSAGSAGKGAISIPTVSVSTLPLRAAMRGGRRGAAAAER